MITTGLFKEVLMKPALDGCDRLCIVSGFATSAMASTHLKRIADAELTLTVDLIVGMTSLSGIPLTHHKGFQKLTNQDYPGFFQCSYIQVPPPVHSKVYVWLRNDVPAQAFIGSANYTQAAFGRQKESLAACDPALGLDYFNSLSGDTIYCTNPDAENRIQIYNDPAEGRRPSKALKSDNEALPDAGTPFGDSSAFPRVCVSFLANDGTLPQTSGLNWGQRDGREPNQAYIRLPAAVYGSDFFPPIAEQFTVLTDDNKVLLCARAQENGKAIHTPANNSEIGIYFRQRLDVPLGDAVQKEHLEQYGRFDVCFYKIDEETYFMEFSSPLV